MWLLYCKALHLIGAVAWFAGLFYLVRIFVYHRECFDKPEPEKSTLSQQFRLMEKRVYRAICNPSMMLTITFGSAMLFLNPAYLKNGWLHVKLLFVVLLLGYHMYCKVILRKLEKEESTMTAFQLRLFNEVPALLLVAIVFLAVLRNTVNPLYILLGVAILGVLIFATAKRYQRARADAE